MLSLLVQALGDRGHQTTIYQHAITEMERILGGDGRPVATSNLELGDSLDDFSAEAKLRAGRPSGLVFAKNRVGMLAKNRIGKNSMETGKKRLGFDGRAYRKEVVANTDYRKFDETLRMVIDVTSDQQDALVAFLEAERTAERLVFGVHVAKSALMTCVVRERRGNHIHFVDGADGGYALAAKKLKTWL